MDITKEQLIFLEDTAKNAAVCASQALSKLIGLPIKLEMTRIRMVEVEKLSSALISPEENVSAVLLPVTGENMGSSALISSLQESYRLAELATKQPKGSIVKLDDLGISALKEIANIIGGSFLSSLSNTTRISLIQSVPKFITDTTKKIIDEAIVKFHPDIKGELLTAFEIDFELSVTTTTTTTTTEAIVTHYIFLFENAFIQKLFKTLKHENIKTLKH